jgi:endonuclease III
MIKYMKTNSNLTEVLSQLSLNYPNAKIALNFKNNWQLFIAVVLSAQCTDKKVNEVTEKLFTKYKDNIPKDEIANYANVALEELEQDIRQTGFYHQKALRIKNSAKLLLEKFNGEIPKTMDEILTLPGVARKTANIVLGNAYGIVVGIPVDTHVIRISQRLRLVDLDKIGGKKIRKFIKKGSEQIDFIDDADPVKIENELMKNIEKKEWFRLAYEIVDHGRALCKAVTPDCGKCFLQTNCPASRV